MSDNSRRVTISFTKDDEELKQKVLEYQEKTGATNRSRALIELIEKGLGMDGPKASSSSYEFDQVSQQLEELRNELALMAESLSGLSQERGAVLKAVEMVQEGQRGLETSVGQISESVTELIREGLASQLQETQSWTRELVSEYGRQLETAWQQNGEANSAQREEAIAKVQNSLAEGLSKLEDRIREVLSREQLGGQQEDAGEGVEALISQLRGDLEREWRQINASLLEGWSKLEKNVRGLIDQKVSGLVGRLSENPSIVPASVVKNDGHEDQASGMAIVCGRDEGNAEPHAGYDIEDTMGDEPSQLRRHDVVSDVAAMDIGRGFYKSSCYIAAMCFIIRDRQGKIL